MAVPPPLRQAIRFDPPLPPAHQALLQRTAMGGMTKILARYSRPFWREQGLNGLGIGDLGAAQATATAERNAQSARQRAHSGDRATLRVARLIPGATLHHLVQCHALA